jgi:hypothetical protein
LNNYSWRPPEEFWSRSTSEQKRSEWGPPDATSPANAGRWGRYIEDAAPPSIDQITTTSALPAGRNRAYQQAMEQSGNRGAAAAMGMAGQALDTSATFSMALSGADRLQNMRQAKEMAQLQQQSQKVSPWSMISQGVSAATGLLGSFARPAPAAPSFNPPNASSSLGAVGFYPQAWR